MFQLGCFWGPASKAVSEVREKYGEKSIYEDAINLAVRVLEENHS